MDMLCGHEIKYKRLTTALFQANIFLWFESFSKLSKHFPVYKMGNLLPWFCKISRIVGSYYQLTLFLAEQTPDLLNLSSSLMTATLPFDAAMCAHVDPSWRTDVKNGYNINIETVNIGWSINLLFPPYVSLTKWKGGGRELDSEVGKQFWLGWLHFFNPPQEQLTSNGMNTHFQRTTFPQEMKFDGSPSKRFQVN